MSAIAKVEVVPTRRRPSLTLVLRSAIDSVQFCPFLRERRPEPQARDELTCRHGERLPHLREVAAPVDVDVAVGIHQALEKRHSLVDRRAEVGLGYVLVAQLA